MMHGKMWIQEMEKEKRRKMLLNFVIVVLVFLMMLMFDSSSAIQYEVNDECLAIAGPENTVFIKSDQITEVELHETSQLLEGITLQNDAKTVCGDYMHKKIGAFSCMLYPGTAECIVVSHGDSTFAFNCHNEQNTIAAYNKLKTILE